MMNFACESSLLQNICCSIAYLTIKGSLVYLATAPLRHGILGSKTKAGNWTVWQLSKHLPSHQKNEWNCLPEYDVQCTVYHNTNSLILARIIFHSCFILTSQSLQQYVKFSRCTHTQARCHNLSGHNGIMTSLDHCPRTSPELVRVGWGCDSEVPHPRISPAVVGAGWGSDSAASWPNDIKCSLSTLCPAPAWPLVH